MDMNIVTDRDSRSHFHKSRYVHYNSTHYVRLNIDQSTGKLLKDYRPVDELVTFEGSMTGHRLLMLTLVVSVPAVISVLCFTFCMVQILRHAYRAETNRIKREMDHGILMAKSQKRLHESMGLPYDEPYWRPRTMGERFKRFMGWKSEPSEWSTYYRQLRYVQISCYYHAFPDEPDDPPCYPGPSILKKTEEDRPSTSTAPPRKKLRFLKSVRFKSRVEIAFDYEEYDSPDDGWYLGEDLTEDMRTEMDPDWYERLYNQRIRKNNNELNVSEIEEDARRDESNEREALLAGPSRINVGSPTRNNMGGRARNDIGGQMRIDLSALDEDPDEQQYVEPVILIRDSRGPLHSESFMNSPHTQRDRSAPRPIPVPVQVHRSPSLDEGLEPIPESSSFEEKFEMEEAGHNETTHDETTPRNWPGTASSFRHYVDCSSSPSGRSAVTVEDGWEDEENFYSTTSLVESDWGTPPQTTPRRSPQTTPRRSPLFSRFSPVGLKRTASDTAAVGMTTLHATMGEAGQRRARQQPYRRLSISDDDETVV